MARISKGSIRIITMLIIFIGVALFALGSYFLLLNKQHNSHNTLDMTPIKPTPKQKALEHPKEFSDNNLQFFYPDTMSMDIASSGAITWKAKLSDGSSMPNAMILRTQTTPFPKPQNTDNNRFFNIDDIEGRTINGIDIMEYTIHCAYRCSHREDQFKIGNKYYQLTFDVFPAGFSEQAELTLNTLNPRFPTPTITQAAKNQPVACTQEAKLCPDGSYVSRTGPHCEFSACPK